MGSGNFVRFVSFVVVGIGCTIVRSVTNPDLSQPPKQISHCLVETRSVF